MVEEKYQRLHPDDRKALKITYERLGKVLQQNEKILIRLNDVTEVEEQRKKDWVHSLTDITELKQKARIASFLFGLLFLGASTHLGYNYGTDAPKAFSTNESVDQKFLQRDLETCVDNYTRKCRKLLGH